MKKLYCLLVMVVVMGLISGCSDSSQGGGDDKKGEKKIPKSMVIVSGNPGGSVYYVCSGQAQILTERLKDRGITVTVETSSSAPIQNMPFVSDDDSASTMSLLTLDGFVAGMEGDKRFGFDPNNPIKNVRFVAAGHTTTLYCITLKSSGIKTIADLKGRKISVPTVGNSAYFQALGIMEEFGVSAENTNMIPMLYSEAGDALKDETIEAIWINGGIPMAAATDLDMTKNIRFLNVGKEVATKLTKKNPYWTMKLLPAGTYKNMTEDTTLMGVYCTISVHENLDDGLVYEITKILNETTEQLTKIHPEGRFWNVEEAQKIIDLNIVPVHPGAQKYYNEIKSKKK